MQDREKQRIYEKQIRSVNAHRCRLLRKPVTSIYVSICLMVGQNKFLEWIEQSKCFPSLLRIMAKEHFGDAEDVSEYWEQGICQIVTDIAEKGMSNSEKVNRDISTPRLIIEWFAEFLERTFHKKELSWNSKLFTKESINPVLDELEILKNNLLKSNSEFNGEANAQL